MQGYLTLPQTSSAAFPKGIAEKQCKLVQVYSFLYLTRTVFFLSFIDPLCEYALDCLHFSILDYCFDFLQLEISNNAKQMLLVPLSSLQDSLLLP